MTTQRSGETMSVLGVNLFVRERSDVRSRLSNMSQTGCVVVTLHLKRVTLVGMPDIFGVIADATRRDILQVLLDEYGHGDGVSVSEIVARLETSQPTVSKHLKVLREAELVNVREEGQHRFYSLIAEPLEMVEDFVIPFLSAGFETEVTVEYLDADGDVVPGPDDHDEEVLPDGVAEAAGKVGRAAAAAQNQVKQLVARFKLPN